MYKRQTINYLKLTGRSADQLELVESYAKTQGLWHDPAHEPRYSEYLELDLGEVVPSIAGPKRPQDRVVLAHAKEGFNEALRDYVDDEAEPHEEVTGYDESVAESFPASDSPTHGGANDSAAPHAYGEHTPATLGRPSKPTPVTLADGTSFTLDHGAVTLSLIHI